MNEGVLPQSHLYDIDSHFATSLDIWSYYQNIVAKDMTTLDVGVSRPHASDRRRGREGHQTRPGKPPMNIN